MPQAAPVGKWFLQRGGWKTGLFLPLKLSAQQDNTISTRSLDR